MRCRKGFKNLNIHELFNLHAHTVAVVRLHFSIKNNPMLKFVFYRCFCFSKLLVYFSLPKSKGQWR